jgi:hypothetical protein
MRANAMAVVAVFTMALAGCTHEVMVSPNSAAVATNGNRVPLNIGLYGGDIKTYVVSESKMGDTWEYNNLGRASFEMFRHALESRFQKVTILTSKPTPGGAIAGGATVVATVEPTISNFSFDIPFTKLQVYPATIQYKITLMGPNGQTLYAATVDGVGDTEGSAGFDFAANPAQSATKAVEEGVRKAVDDLANSPAVQALAKSAGEVPAS